MAHEITPKTRPNLYATTTEEKTMPYHTGKAKTKKKKTTKKKKKTTMSKKKSY
tara:strand:+ start:775 stop:933 length:159 start_codon:yes stop_codon:yes gene_type:complete